MVNDNKCVVPADPVAAKDVRRIDVRTLLDGQRELLLEHEGQTYHLRITANGKLILTK
jgi:hemin uptake protein HemP